MSERLIIKNFAGIKKLDLDVRQITILIGPQATGKSVCAKLLYFFKSFIKELFKYNYNENPQIKRGLDSLLINKFQNYFPIESLSKEPFSIRYELNEQFIEVNRKKLKISISYSEGYTKAIDKYMESLWPISEKVDMEIMEETYKIRKENMQYAKEQIGEIGAFQPLFIPAGRSFFAILQRSIFSFLSDNNSIDPFLAEFGSFYENSKTHRLRLKFDSDMQKELKLKKKLDSIIDKILGGKYTRKKGKDLIICEDGRQTSVANSSSGQQEVLPLVIILGNAPFIEWIRDGQCIYIEEPEAHLFPTTQRDIVELIALVYNSAMKPSHFFITTHSPYILTAFNNLLQAGYVESKLPEESKDSLYNIIPRDRILKPGNVIAYSLSDGGGHCILDSETGLITTNIIDDVSNELSKQFGDLLDIEM